MKSKFEPFVVLAIVALLAAAWFRWTSAVQAPAGATTPSASPTRQPAPKIAPVFQLGGVSLEMSPEQVKTILPGAVGPSDLPDGTGTWTCSGQGQLEVGFLKGKVHRIAGSGDWILTRQGRAVPGLGRPIQEMEAVLGMAPRQMVKGIFFSRYRNPEGDMVVQYDREGIIVGLTMEGPAAK